jgi:copper(I)-binding protein
VTLVTASGPLFGRIELHGTVTEGGIARMIHQESLTIEPGQRLTLSPGGLHLMLMTPKQHLRAGDKVQIELHFEDGTRLPVTAEVRKEMP